MNQFSIKILFSSFVKINVCSYHRITHSHINHKYTTTQLHIKHYNKYHHITLQHKITSMTISCSTALLFYWAVSKKELCLLVFRSRYYGFCDLTHVGVCSGQYYRQFLICARRSDAFGCATSYFKIYKGKGFCGMNARNPASRLTYFYTDWRYTDYNAARAMNDASENPFSNRTTVKEYIGMYRYSYAALAIVAEFLILFIVEIFKTFILNYG